MMPKPWNKGTYLSYKNASKIVQKLNIKTQSEYRRYSKSKKLPKNIPGDPYAVYTRTGEWKSWPDYLRGGKKIERITLSPEERKRRKAKSDKKYHEKNKEKIAIYNKKYNSKPEIIAREKNRKKQYHIKNREKIIARATLWNKQNKEQYNSRIRKNNKSQKYRVLTHYSKKQSNSDVPCCSCCGENEFLIFLTIDHVRGRKYSDDYINTTEKKARNAITGKVMYDKLEKQNFPNGYRVLCWNCNSARDKQPDKICPHQRNKR